MAGLRVRVCSGCVLILTILLLHSLGVVAHGASSDDKVVAKFVGKNWVNGRAWEKLEYGGKLGFVCGVFDGVTLFWSLADNGKSVKKGSLNPVYDSISIPSALTVGDVVVGMDEFYKDPDNKELPAICAYLHFVYRSRGDNSDAVEKRVAVWRKMFEP
ncbi:MAG: hypothetical protein ACLGPL_04810 [Acidobacteriota bacterium]